MNEIVKILALDHQKKGPQYIFRIPQTKAVISHMLCRAFWRALVHFRPWCLGTLGWRLSQSCVTMRTR